MRTMKPLRFRYINWQGESEVRTVVPKLLFWGSTEFHPQEQWLLRAQDVERNAERTFAVKDIQGIEEVEP